VLTGELAADLRVDERTRRHHRAMRKSPRLTGLKMLGMGVGCIALNFALITFMERYYVVLFPLGGAVAGLGLAVLVTGRPMTGSEKNLPLTYRALAGALFIGGGLAGIALNFMV
jgi:hypothetical protein